MNNKGLVGKIILTGVLVLLVIGGGAAFYFYNYYVFKTVRVCVGESVDSGLPCGNYLDCLEYFDFNDEGLDGAPQFLRLNFDNVLRAAVSCDKTCSVGEVRGINYESGEIEDLESCASNEQEFVMEIKGKEGLEVLNWIKNKA